MPAFHEVQFPTDISYGSAGGPEFSTEVVELGNGAEQRNINWAYSRERWNVAYGIKAQEDLDALMSFFYARRGRAHGFRFKNHADYQATGVELTEGDDGWQLAKVYTSGLYTYTRKIVKPVQDSVTVYIDGTPLENSAGDPEGWSIDLETGIITFESGNEPGSGETVTVDFEFDVPVRFDTDHLPQSLETYRARAASVPIVELML